MRQARTLLQLAERGIEDMHWYSRARAEIERRCTHEGWDAGKFADLLALTSPRVQVSRNWSIAVHYMRTGEWQPGVMSVTKENVQDWQRNGEVPMHLLKVYPFSRALRGDDSALVLDTWMARALHVPESGLKSSFVRIRAAQRVSQVAAQLGWTITQTQAAIWSAELEAHGRTVYYYAEQES
jgi:hypothetical protein